MNSSVNNRNLDDRRQGFGWLVTLICGLMITLQTGCQMTRTALTQRAASVATLGTKPIVDLRPVKRLEDGNPLINRLTKSARQPSERAQLLLREYDLLRRYRQDPDSVINFLTELAGNGATMEEVSALAEVSEIQADWSMSIGDQQRAARLYATAVLHSYQFLFDPKHEMNRNAYDPQFRSICDTYNRSLEGLLREVCSAEKLQPGHMVKIGNAQRGIEFEVQLEGRWKDQEFERFELVSDYEARGIENHYHTYGLGVPLIAVRKQQQESHSNYEKYYPPDLTLPMTAFMRLQPGEVESLWKSQTDSGPEFNVSRAILSLYDPLERTQVKLDSQVIPLESDITTPLAYGLKNPLVNRGVYATAALLNAEFAPELFGMYMLEPYDPNKIPVVMVHGLWSSPVTWVHMFNDLRANHDIHDNYQFWFYAYPTGQPFWISAQQMRRDLASIHRELDPRGDSQSLDQMILVGHSMGGLISLMQTQESEDHYWNVISDQPIESLVGNANTIDLLRKTFYFHPNPAIERVITIATPLKGSEFANGAARWVSHKLITLPNVVTRDFKALAAANKNKIKSSSMLTTATSIDSLSPSDEVFDALAIAKQASRVKTHNIVGRLPQRLLARISGSSNQSSGDGIVKVESAHNDVAVSEVFVPAEHSSVHQHPGAIYEVRRVLLEHLAEYDRIRVREIPKRPSVQQATRLEPIMVDPASSFQR